MSGAIVINDHVKDKSSIGQKYYCRICKNIFRNVHQIDCGCRFCLECTDFVLVQTKCNDCNEVIESKVKIPDKAFQKEINNLVVECNYCEWNGKIGEFTQHLLDHSMNNKCKYCNKGFYSSKYLNNHLDEASGDCQLQILKCSYNDVGCTKELVRPLMEKHLDDEAKMHLDLLHSYVMPRLSEIEIKMTNISEGNSEVSMDTTNTQKKTVSSNPKIDVKNLGLKNKLDEVYKKLDEIEKSHRNSEHQVKNFTISYEKMCLDLNKAYDNEKLLREEIETLKKNLLCSQVICNNLDEKLSASERVSYNGILIWKISNVAQKILESKSGQQTSFYSPVFYTSSNGYKMRARVYLNGDGAGKGTHLSVFLTILQGEYDDLLKWPFTNKVTFILLDRNKNESRENIVDAFKPDPRSSSFQRPTTDMNIASGIPLFCSLSKLNSSDHSYIKDDIIFLKVVVDSAGLIDI